MTGILAVALALVLLCTLSVHAFDDKKAFTRAIFARCDVNKPLVECLELLEFGPEDRELGSSTSTRSSNYSANASNTTYDGHIGSAHGYHADDHLVIITLTLVMMVGAFTHQFIKATELSVPYTSVLYVVLFGLFERTLEVLSSPHLTSPHHTRIPANSCNSLLEGMFIGSLIYFANKDPTIDLGDMGKSANRIAAIDSHLMLYIFLPPLIFESAFSIEWHVFKKTGLKVALLAGPGLLICASLTGAGAVGIYDWYVNVESITGQSEMDALSLSKARRQPTTQHACDFPSK